MSPQLMAAMIISRLSDKETNTKEEENLGKVIFAFAHCESPQTQHCTDNDPKQRPIQNVNGSNLGSFTKFSEEACSLLTDSSCLRPIGLVAQDFCHVFWIG